MRSKISRIFIAIVTYFTVFNLINLNGYAKESELTKVNYSCLKDTLEVIYVNTINNSYAIINRQNEMIILERAISASGAIYKSIDKNYNYQLYTKNNEANLFTGEEKIIGSCHLK